MIRSSHKHQVPPRDLSQGFENLFHIRRSKPPLALSWWVNSHSKSFQRALFPSIHFRDLIPSVSYSGGLKLKTSKEQTTRSHRRRDGRRSPVAEVKIWVGTYDRRLNRRQRLVSEQPAAAETRERGTPSQLQCLCQPRRALRDRAVIKRCFPRSLRGALIPFATCTKKS
jgi:hypothetical protein